MAAPRRKKAEAEASAAKADNVPVTVTLPVKVGFVEARMLHEELAPLCDTPEVVFDAGSVEWLSTAGALVLTSFLNARADMTPPAAVLNPPGAFVDAFSELGLFDKLMRMEFRS